MEKENLHDNRKSTIEDKICKSKSYNMTGEMVVKRQEIRIQIVGIKLNKTHPP